MAKFIELTTRDKGKKMLINTQNIIYIYTTDDEKSTFILMRDSKSYQVREPYEDIKKILENF